MHTAQELLDLYWDGNLPVNTEAMANAIGIQVIADDVILACAMISVEKNKIVIRLKSAIVHPQRSYVIAHQVGHYVLGHLNNPDKSCRDELGNFRINVASLVEKEANQFALSLLIPEKTLRYAISHKGYCVLTNLSKLFAVSEVAMQRRLLDLKIIPK